MSSDSVSIFNPEVVRTNGSSYVGSFSYGEVTNGEETEWVL